MTKNHGSYALVALAACGPAASLSVPAGAPATVASTPTSPPQPPPAPFVHHPTVLVPFAVYPIVVEGDPFPTGPSMPTSLQALVGLRAGGQRFGWGLTGWPGHGNSHYITLDGAPTDSAADLLALSDAPKPELAPGARLIFLAESPFFPDKPIWRYRSVVIDSHPLLTADDLAGCSVKEGTFSADGVISPQPSLRLKFTPEAQRKLGALPPLTPLCPAFGDEALNWVWFPDQTEPDFAIAGVTVEMKRRRAQEMLAVCPNQPAPR